MHLTYNCGFVFTTPTAVNSIYLENGDSSGTVTDSLDVEYSDDCAADGSGGTWTASGATTPPLTANLICTITVPSVGAHIGWRLRLPGAGGSGVYSCTIRTIDFMSSSSPTPDPTKRYPELAEDGSAVSRTLYEQLFNKIGTTFGSGDASTTFNLPSTPLVRLGPEVLQTAAAYYHATWFGPPPWYGANQYSTKKNMSQLQLLGFDIENFDILGSNDSTNGLDGTWDTITTITGNPAGTVYTVYPISGGSYYFFKISITTPWSSTPYILTMDFVGVEESQVKHRYILT